MGKAPCLGCSDRCIGCHSSCTKYIEWKRDIDKENETIRKNRVEYRILTDMEEYRLSKN